MNLLQVLLAFVAAYLEGNYPLQKLGSVLTPANVKLAAEDVPALINAFNAYRKGAELPWPELVADLRAYIKVYSAQPKARPTFVKALKAFATYFNNGSEAALTAITKLSALVEDPALKQSFGTEANTDQSSAIKTLTKLVKGFGGKGFALTLEQSKEAKLQDPDAYAQYLAAMREFNAAWKAGVSLYVRSTGKTTVPMADALDFLHQNGITHTMPEGFTGNIDANCLWYTRKGMVISGGAPSSTMFPTVRMNPRQSADDPWVFQAIRADGTAGNYFYTEEHQRQKAAEKFAKVQKFDVEKTRKKWLSLLKQLDPDHPTPHQVAALVIELLYRTSNRIGTRPGGNPTGGGFGICTLLVGHFYPQNDGSIKFIYLGKDSVKTTAVVKPTTDAVAKFVCAAVYKLVEGKTKKEPIFTYRLKNGQNKLVQPQVVTDVFKQMSGGLTVHKLRTAAGTSVFNELMDTVYEKYKSLDPKSAMELLKKAATAVGKRLNHVKRSADGTSTVQPMTSLKNYIDVGAQLAFFEHYGLLIPPYLEKFLAEDESAGLYGEDGIEGYYQEDRMPAVLDFRVPEPVTAAQPVGRWVEYANELEKPADPNDGLADDDTMTLPSEALLQYALQNGAETIFGRD